LFLFLFSILPPHNHYNQQLPTTDIPKPATTTTTIIITTTTNYDNQLPPPQPTSNHVNTKDHSNSKSHKQPHG